MKDIILPEHMKYAPTVFAIKDTYQIFAVIDASATFWVEIGGVKYYDESNGIMRSETPVHRVEVPMKALDEAKKYTTVFRLYPDRQPYYPQGSEPYETEFEFRPVPPEKKKINILQISDTHNLTAEPIAFSDKWRDDTDILVLNGDIPDSSATAEHILAVFAISGGVTRGMIPTVFSRGNHDTRGLCAEEFERYTPTRNGLTYYSFRCGGLWGLVLDCGEDKDDASVEYGGTICMHGFRLRETEYIKRIIADSENEYAAPDVNHVVVICHIPFTYIDHAPFNIENEIYSEWSEMMRDSVKPEVMIYGHMHRAEIWRKGGENDHRGQCADAVIGGIPFHKNEKRDADFIGAMIELGEEKGAPIRVTFSDSKGQTTGEGVI
ncbi:MAG: metallophosphoesterase [Clostridiales bacterium]|nr:metallophosphoesterase [Clostridiales bacterium]